MNQNNTPQQVSIFVRDNLTLLVTVGEKALEIALTPQYALELGAALINTGLEVARNNAAARTGAMAAIGKAASSEEREEIHDGG